MDKSILETSASSAVTKARYPSLVPFILFGVLFDCIPLFVLITVFLHLLNTALPRISYVQSVQRYALKLLNVEVCTVYWCNERASNRYSSHKTGSHTL
jgi:hypothetical protein